MSIELSARVLVVDDDPVVAEFLETCIVGQGYDVRRAVDGEAALREVAEFDPSIVFLDVVIPEADGWLVCSKLKLQPGCPAVVLMADQPGHSMRRFAHFVQADALLEKPFTAEQALAVLHHVRGALAGQPSRLW